MSYLTDLLNAVQKHSICTAEYCIRKKPVRQEDDTTTEVSQCRFYFPRPRRSSTGLPLDMNPNHWTFAPGRNDGTLNNYNRPAWQANTDIAPCVEHQAIINYLAKYASKGEKESKSYKEPANGCCRRSQVSTPSCHSPRRP